MKKTLVIIPDKDAKRDSGYWLIDPDNGDVLNSHLCSTSGFAKSDLHDKRPIKLKEWKEKYGMETEAKFLSETDYDFEKDIYSKFNLGDRLRLVEYNRKFIEDSELIIDFVFKKDDDFDGHVIDYENNVPILNFTLYRNLASQDWNILMTAVEYIENLPNEYRIEINKNTCVISGGEYFDRVTAKSKIEAVYNAILNFIKDYNTTKNVL